MVCYSPVKGNVGRANIGMVLPVFIAVGQDRDVVVIVAIQHQLRDAVMVRFTISQRMGVAMVSCIINQLMDAVGVVYIVNRIIYVAAQWPGLNHLGMTLVVEIGRIIVPLRDVVME